MNSYVIFTIEFAVYKTIAMLLALIKITPMATSMLCNLLLALWHACIPSDYISYL